MTIDELKAENKQLKAILAEVRPYFSWGLFVLDGQEVGDCSPGAPVRIVNQRLCQRIDAAVPPPWAKVA